MRHKMGNQKKGNLKKFKSRISPLPGDLRTAVENVKRDRRNDVQTEYEMADQTEKKEKIFRFEEFFKGESDVVRSRRKHQDIRGNDGKNQHEDAHRD